MNGFKVILREIYFPILPLGFLAFMNIFIMVPCSPLKALLLKNGQLTVTQRRNRIFSTASC